MIKNKEVIDSSWFSKEIPPNERKKEWEINLNHKEQQETIILWNIKKFIFSKI